REPNGRCSSRISSTRSTLYAAGSPIKVVNPEVFMPPLIRGDFKCCSSVECVCGTFLARFPARRPRIATKERRASDAALPFSSCRWIVDPKVRMLGAVPLFQGLSARELMDIVEVARDVEFPAGTTIVSQGSQATDFFLILDGEARGTVGRRERRDPPH